MKGIIKFFNQEKAFGFISCEDQKQYFFHISDFEDFIDKSKVVENTEVEFKPMIGVNFTIKALITKPRSIIIDPTTWRVFINVLSSDCLFFLFSSEFDGLSANLLHPRIFLYIVINLNL